jgi:hypothetical protein
LQITNLRGKFFNLKQRYFFGHVAGITYVDTRQDGRYFISNGKDQSVKLWDVRRSETSEKDKVFHKINFDYRSYMMQESVIEKIKNLT